MRHARTAAALVLAAAALGACGGGDTEEGPDQAPVDDDRPAQTQPAPDESKRGKE